MRISHYFKFMFYLDLPNRPRKMSPENRLQRLVFAKRAPLEKSLSLPDVQNNAKKRERMLA